LTVFYKELIETLGKMDYGYELILINDGSDDGTLVCKKFWKGGRHVCWFL